MCHISIHAITSLLVPLILLRSVQAQSEFDGAITCYGFNGGEYYNNTQCPDSNACCGYTSTCLSNRLCHNNNDPVGTFVRGPCLTDPWSSGCAQICQYDEGGLGGVLPRVNICADGSYCCNNDTQCCQSGRGTFLDANGDIVASTASSLITAPVTSFPPINTSLGTSRFTETPSTTTTSSTSSATTTSATNTSPVPTTSPTNTQSSSSSGVKIGVGVGVSLGVLLVAAGLGFFFYYRRKRQYTVDEPASTNSESYPLEVKPYRAAEMYTDAHPAAMEMDGWRPSELDGPTNTIRSELP